MCIRDRPNRVLDEEGEEKEEKRCNFCGSIQDDKNASVDIELQDSEGTSLLNPDAAEYVPVSPSLFMTDPGPVTSSSPTPGDEKSRDGGALPSSVEFNLDIAHGPGQLDSRLGNIEEVVVAESGEEEESKEEAEELSLIHI